LLALLLQPNTVLPWFGKLLFTAGDLCIGYLLYRILSNSGYPHNTSLTGAALWLLNPISAGVSTRGNAESLLGCVILCAIYAVKQNRPICAGVALSLAVHLKIYPIIYSLPLYLYLAYCSPGHHSFFNSRTVRFVLSFLTVQALLISIFYHFYGYDFVFESYLYHFVRTDTRHNFSPYFYLLYLSRYATVSHVGAWLRFLCFLPQALLALAFSLKHYVNPELCLTLQTLTFVIFNKVSTSQYFLWYLWLLPLLYPRLKLKLGHASFLAVLWFAGQGLWLLTGYLVEFECLNYFLSMHIASLIFLLSQCYIVCCLLCSSRSLISEKVD
jgi:phosphatidylinositol glycan class M